MSPYTSGLQPVVKVYIKWQNTSPSSIESYNITNPSFTLSYKQTIIHLNSNTFK